MWCDRQLVRLRARLARSCPQISLDRISMDHISIITVGATSQDYPWACEIRKWSKIANVIRNSDRCRRKRLLSDSDFCPKSLIRLSDRCRCRTGVAQSFDSCPAVLRQLSGSTSAVVRQYFGSCPAVLRQLSGSTSAVVRQYFGSFPAVYLCHPKVIVFVVSPYCDWWVALLWQRAVG